MSLRMELTLKLMRSSCHRSAVDGGRARGQAEKARGDGHKRVRGKSIRRVAGPLAPRKMNDLGSLTRWGGGAYPGVVLGRHAREVEPERGADERRAEREREHRSAHDVGSTVLDHCDAGRSTRASHQAVKIGPRDGCQIGQFSDSPKNVRALVRVTPPGGAPIGSSTPRRVRPRRTSTTPPLQRRRHLRLRPRRGNLRLRRLPPAAPDTAVPFDASSAVGAHHPRRVSA